MGFTVLASTRTAGWVLLLSLWAAGVLGPTTVESSVWGRIPRVSRRTTACRVVLPAAAHELSNDVLLLKLHLSTPVESSTHSIASLIPRGGGGGGGGGGALDANDTTAPNPSRTILLRIRRPDGSLHKMNLDAAQMATTTVHDILHALQAPTDTVVSIRASGQICDAQRTLDELDVTHGTLLTLGATNTNVTPPTQSISSWSHRSSANTARYNPFPDLAKDYTAALQKRRSSSVASYSAVASLQRAMHVIEAQPLTRDMMQRVYMCHVAAARIRAASTNRVAWLYGTLVRERHDLTRKPIVARTSLSSTKGDEYCTVARVHAVWSGGASPDNDTFPDASVARVASYLGLRLVGWMFVYENNRSVDDDGLPVWGTELVTGARLQIHHMQQEDGTLNTADPSPFPVPPPQLVTLAMDATSGTTEAFQLSDVAVQMVAEDILIPSSEPSRYVTTRHPVLMDGQETTTLDSVLCLVNTALLSQEGWYAGRSKSVSKTGSLTRKVRRSLVAALDDANASSAAALALLCDMAVLVTLDAVLTRSESQLLCRTVQKYARGQRTSTVLPPALVDRLRHILTD